MKIDGVNSDIASALYKTGYRDLESFNEAIIEDLILVKGVTPTLARRILKNIKEPLTTAATKESTTFKQQKPFYDMKGVWFIKATLWGLLFIWIIGLSLIPIDFFSGQPIVTLSCIFLSIILLIIARIWAGLYWGTYFFQIRDSEIVVEFGVLFHKRTIIPFKRIQNVNVVQGPIMRFYGLKSILIETAGGTIYRPGPSGTGLSEGQIPAPENPEELAEMIIQQVEKYKAAEGL